MQLVKNGKTEFVDGGIPRSSCLVEVFHFPFPEFVHGHLSLGFRIVQQGFQLLYRSVYYSELRNFPKPLAVCL